MRDKTTSHRTLRLRPLSGVGSALGLKRAVGLKTAVGLVMCITVAVVFSSPIYGDSARGDIKVKTLEDGTHLIFNENSTQRARRISTRLMPVPAATGLEPLIRKYALKEGLSPRLVQSVVQVESGYNPKALSSKGAMGLMQLMPATARELGVTDPWDPEQNIRGGARYLRLQMDRFGDLTLALAAYNAGPTAVARYKGIPPYKETQRYVQKVLGLYQKTPPPLLRQYAEQKARLAERKAETKRAEEAKTRGKDVYVTRDENNNIIFTTEPPD